MSDDDIPTVQRAAMVPIAWNVECPCCGVEVVVPEVEQDDAGVYFAARSDCVIACEDCGTLIEPNGARVVGHCGTPYRQPSWAR